MPSSVEGFGLLHLIDGLGVHRDLTVQQREEAAKVALEALLTKNAQASREEIVRTVLQAAAPEIFKP